MKLIGARPWSGACLRNVTLLLGLMGPFAAPQAGHAPPPAQEYEVKAAFLLNFTKFIGWPAAAFEDAHSPFAICVLGQDPFGGALEQVVEGEEVNGHKIAIRRIQREPHPRECQELFVSSSEKNISAIVEGLGRGVLTVGEHAGFLRDGGIIDFVIEDRHVRFDISRSAAANAGLTISARLLSVARSAK